MIFNYIEDLGEIIEFLLALGSIMGMLGLVIGLIGWLFLGQFQRKKVIGLMIVSVILLMVCGVNTGIRYFRIY
jgi:Ca2+/Na+ antiporter